MNRYILQIVQKSIASKEEEYVDSKDDRNDKVTALIYDGTNRHSVIVFTLLNIGAVYI